MALGPINYMEGFQPINLAQQFTQGLQAGVGIQQVQQQRLAQEQAILAAQEKQRREQEFSTEFSDYLLKPNATKWAALVGKNPGMREALGDINKTLSADQARVEQRDAIELYTALGSDVNVAKSLVEEKIEAAKNSGRPTEELEATLRGIDTSPSIVRGLAFGRAVSLPDGDKLAKSLLDAEEGARKAELQPTAVREAGARATIAEAEASVAPQMARLGVEGKAWETANVRSTIEDRAARLSFDKDKALSDYQAKLTERGDALAKLPESAVKLVTDSTLAATVAEQSASSMDNLAAEFDKLGGGFGGFGSAAEAAAKFTGNQDAMTRARQEFLRLKNSAVVKSLPPGPATDRDISLFSKGFPDETADSKYLASFLRGMAKVQRREAVIETAKADWVEANGGLLRNKRDAEIAGVRVPAGAKFDAFVNKFAERKASEKAAEAAIGSIQSRPYMRWANQ
jgi:hypothetical protein